ncbi:MAG: sigma-70 family RNA polymerase sigma factor [Planctomycetota bacterium]
MDTRSESLPPRAEALLSQSDWVRSLVRGLGVDESGAEDVLQSTWLAALTRPPRTEGEGASLRAWVARVARNFALKRLDRDNRRAARERAGAKEERLPSASDVVEREEARAQVVRALLDVSEPYRTTLLLRFYENLEPRDIARLQGVPGSTVRNRLKRGLELLGERLERDLGATWRQRCVLVLPLIRAIPSVPGGTSGPADGSRNGGPRSGSGNGSGGVTKWIPKNGTTGGGLVVEKIGLAAAALLATGGLVLTWTWSTSEPDAVASGGSSLSSDLATTGESGAGSSSASNLASELVPAEIGKSRERASSTAGTDSSGDSGVRCSLSGRLLGPDGQPLAPQSAYMRYRLALGEDAALSSESAGPSAPAAIDSALAGEAYMRVRQEYTPVDASEAQPAPLSPQVVDGLDYAEAAQGLILERIPLVSEFYVESSFAPEDSLGLQPRVVLSNAAGEAFEASTDGEGAFRFDGLRPDRWQLFAEAPGCQSRRMEIEIKSSEREEALDLALDAIVRLRVKLVTPDGKDLRETLLAGDDSAFLFAPVPFARRLRPNERIRDLSEEPSRRYGSGRWQEKSDLADDTLGDASGILEIHDRLPLFVGVSACGFVLETRMVNSGEEEVVFVIAPEKIRALAATVALRVVSKEDGLPLHGVVAWIGELPEVASDASGAVETAKVPPGRGLLVLEAPGYGRREEWIDVAPGARTDLGTRSLDHPVEISGRVVDESWNPLQVSLELASVDRFVLGSMMPFEGMTDSAEDGTFRFTDVGGGLHLLWVENIADPIRVDTRRGKATDVVVRASERHTVRVMFPIEPPPDANYLLEMADGTPIRTTPCEGWKPFEASLGPGSYRARLVDGPGALWTRLIHVQSGAVIVSDEPLEEKR